MGRRLVLVFSLVLLTGVIACGVAGCVARSPVSLEATSLRAGRPAGAAGQAGTEIRVGHWNIRDFSARSRTPEALRKIAQVAHSFDCLAICEINDDTVLGKLAVAADALGGQWKAVQTSQKVGNTPASSEFYGFLYRSDKLRVRAPPRTLPEVECPVAGGEAIRFDREPSVCSFATLDGRMDFTLIEVHVTWGEKVVYRQAEIRALKNYFEDVRDSDPGDKDVLLCGDFNRDVGDKGSMTVLLAVPDMIDTTSPDVPTMVGSSHTYDHLLFQTSFVREYTGEHGVVKFDETLFRNDEAGAKKTCSDHRPVWVTLRVSDRDDD